MSIFALPSPNDPRFQEMFSKAVSQPDAEPARPATEGGLDLEALKRELREGMAWLAENVHKWKRPCDPAPASPGAVREGGNFISRFFRRIADWLKKGFSHLRELFTRPSAAAVAATSATQSTPDSADTPPCSATTTEPAQAREPGPAAPSIARAEVMRDLMSGLYRHVAGFGTESRSRGAVPKNTTQDEARS